MLRKKILFGFDFPVIAPDHWLADFAQLEIKDDVRPLILKDNAIRMLGLAPAPSTTRPPRTDNGVDDDRRNHPHPGRHRRRRTGRPHALPPAPSAAYRSVVLDLRSRADIEKTVRAGVLEQSTVDLMTPPASATAWPATGAAPRDQPVLQRRAAPHRSPPALRWPGADPSGMNSAGTPRSAMAS